MYKNVTDLANVSVKTLLVSVLACFFISIAFVQGAAAEKEPIILKYAHQLPESQPVAKQARVFKELVEERSDGNVIIEVYPSAQLFGARELLPAVRKGSVDIAAVVSGPMVGLVPIMEVWDLPFLIDNWDQAREVWEGYPGDVMREDIEEVGAITLAAGYYGFVSIANSVRQLKLPEDIEGLKIRTVGPLAAEMIEAMGGSSVVMGGDEAYLALARGTVDGSMNGVVSYASRQYWEVQEYASILNVYFNPIPMLINKKVWEDLPKDVQSLLQECAAESDEFVFEESKRYANEAAQIIQDKGMKVYYPTPEEMAEWKKATEPVRSGWIKKHGETAKKVVEWIRALD